MRNVNNGSNLESFVNGTLSNLGFINIDFKTWEKTKPKGKYLIKHFPYTSIYETKCKTEFLIQDDDRFIRIECKWQQVSGSVDEKFAYMYLNAVCKWQENEIILLIDGNGYRQNALEWIKNSAKNKLYYPDNCDKVIKVWDMREFLIWANNGMQQLTY